MKILNNINGVINVYKEPGMTSFQVVAKVRGMYKVKKCGHTGTLDPMAEGVLPICLGHATRFAEILADGDKQYIASFRLGQSYDTYDTTGTVRDRSELIPEYSQVEAVLSEFIGEQNLVVPAFSAKKINGQRAYDLARSGELEDAGSSLMSIHNISLQSYSYPDGIFVVDCGKGTYVRSIIHEMGNRLGSYAAMSGLIRSKNGIFNMSTAHRLSSLTELLAEDRGLEAVMPVENTVSTPKAIVKDNITVDRIMNGISPKQAEYSQIPGLSKGDMCMVLSPKGEIVALGTYDEITPIKLSKVFK